MAFWRLRVQIFYFDQVLVEFCHKWMITSVGSGDHSLSCKHEIVRLIFIFLHKLRLTNHCSCFGSEIIVLVIT